MPTDTKTKVTFLYNAFAFKQHTGESPYPVSSTGWSETWYFPAALDSATLYQAVNRYADLRRSTLAKNCVLKYVRYTQVDPVGPKYLEKWDYAGRDEDNNDFSTAILYSFYDPTYTQRRHFLVRGVPDFYCETGAYLPNAGYKTKMSNWLKAIADDNWQFHGKDLTGLSARIRTITLGAGERYIVETETPHGMALNDNVQILRTRRQTDFRIRGASSKIHEVVDANKVSLTAWPHAVCKGGTIRQMLPDRFIDATITNDESRAGTLTHRDPGRPFGLSRGRRSPKLA